MFAINKLLKQLKRNGADQQELDIFCYFAYYPYLNNNN